MYVLPIKRRWKILKEKKIPDTDRLAYGYFVPLMGGREVTLEGPVCSSYWEITEHRIGPHHGSDGVWTSDLLISSCVLTWAHR